MFGGTFNPPHTTHRRIVVAALDQLPIDELLVMPAGHHPHKRGRDIAPADQRLAMCRLAFAGLAGVVVDDRELRRAGPSFTVDTIAELAEQHLGRPIWFVIGADNLALMPTWHDHHRLLRLTNVATFPRHGTTIDERALVGLDLRDDERAHLCKHRLQLPPDAVSAADIRRRLARGQRNLAELQREVEDHIVSHHLYGT